MSLNLGVMSAAVTLDDAQYRKKLSGLEDTSESTFKRVAALAAGYLSLRVIGGFGANGIKEFSALEEACNKFDNVFKAIPDTSRKVSEALMRDFDLSEQSAKDMLSATGDLLTGFNFTADAALDLSNRAARLGADLASYSNYAGGAKGAALALTAAMLGETEKAKALGVVIRQDSEEYINLVKQYQTTQGATLMQAKAMAALEIATNQSKNAIGDWSRPGETLAQTQMKLEERTRTFTASIGEHLAQAIHPAAKAYADLLKSYNNLDPASRQLITTTAALAASFALVSKTGMLSAANKSLGTIGLAIAGGGLSGIKEKAEVDAVASSENLKRAEYAKTDAFREAHAAAQSIRIARLAVQEQDAAVNSTKAQLASAQTSGDATQILTAKKQLAVATQNLTKAQLAESSATQQLAAKHFIAKTASVQHAAASTACAVANVVNASASTLAGRAHVVLSAGLAKARVAASALAASLGPIGAAMIALSGVYMAFQYLSEKNRNELEGQVELAHQNSEAANEMAAAHEKERSENDARLQRLQELAQYERLNNSERKEAETLIEALSQKYGDLGISIDGVTGKLTIGAAAWEQMNEAQSKELTSDLGNKLRSTINEATSMQIALRDELSSVWKNSIVASGIASVGNLFGSDDNEAGDFSHRAKHSERQQELDRIMGLRTLEEQISGLESMRNNLFEEGSKEQANAVDEVIKKIQEQQEIQKELDAAREASKKGESVASGKTEQKQREQSDAKRSAETALATTEWNIKFNSADAESQLEMLNEKVVSILKKQSGKYANLASFKSADRATMTEQELKDLAEIVELEEQRTHIREQSAEHEIKQAQQSGDKFGADAIMRRELEKAREYAKNMQFQYQQATMYAEADSVLTEDERKRIQDLKLKMRKAMSDEDKWHNRVNDFGEKEKSQQKTAGAWSVNLLEAMLGGGNPEKETAKNTKETVNLLRELKNRPATGAVFYN